MAKKKLSFSEMLQRTLDKQKKRQEENVRLFRAEQIRQGVKPDQPIDLMSMVKGMKERKKK